MSREHDSSRSAPTPSGFEYMKNEKKIDQLANRVTGIEEQLARLIRITEALGRELFPDG